NASVRPRLSIIIPNYNEKANIQAGAIEEVENYLKSAKFTWEVIISDDGSSDGSRDLIEKTIKDKSGFRLLKNPHSGKAGAIWYGIQAAKGEIVLFSDMDQSTPLKEIEKLLPWYDKGYEVVFGSRGTMRENFPLIRQLASWSFRSSWLKKEATN
ncbi:glycosyltransferase family 2 protein, partial [Candidatus Collierbacteria bacterium]|nr:glycosyltransferase family 2 protein [Candidatus Collierbacteria bacterium]